MTSQQKVVVVTVELTPAEAECYAQFLKRVGWRDYRQNAIDDVEARVMQRAGDLLSLAFAKSGYAPR